ncbi:hypothetical protein JW979_08765 [bacterium]|nr:hypothetical protein [candidate division CSSED10-310 bacterium]
MNPRRNPIFPKRLIHFTQVVAQHGGRALLIGGSVRDWLLGKPWKDFDIEVYGILPEKLLELCKSEGSVNLVGASFAVLKVQLSRTLHIDVSIPRKERSTGSGHTAFMIETDPFMSFKIAAQRRDLTVNAISYDPLTHEIIDPCLGMTDIQVKVLRHIGSKFREDPLRVLRVLRFMAQLGFDIAPETFDVCKNMTLEGCLQSLPRERIEEELKNLLINGKSGFIERALRTASDMGIFNMIMPEIEQLKDIQQDPIYHAEGNCFTHTILAVDKAAGIAKRDGLNNTERYVLCLAALVHDLGKYHTTTVDNDGRIRTYGHDKAVKTDAFPLLERICSNKKTIEQVFGLAETHMQPLHLVQADVVSDAAIRRLASKICPSSLFDLARLVEADTMASWSSQSKQKMNAHIFLRERALSLGVQNKPIEPLLMGRDLIELARYGKIPQKYCAGGPHFKHLLDKLYNAQLDGLIHSKKEAVDFLLNLEETGDII